jgi:HAD superfamily hydrolase (TIGR01509 family)
MPDEAIIFDMDGTLADSIEQYCRMARDDRSLGAAVPRERVLALMGSGTPDLLRRLLPDDYPDAEAALERVVRARLRSWLRSLDDIDPLPGCVDLLRRLHGEGHRLGIATSSGRALPYLDRWGVRALFTIIVGREDVRNRKPHPEAVLRCLAGLGVENERALYVGDSPIDVAAGRAAGVRTVGVLTGTSPRHVLEAAGSDHILGSAAELRELLADDPGSIDSRGR